ncbi:MAG: hypothetical protein PHD97_13260 [Bacteroidales bacterium]|nr:hypothetical protein [Bacteroidales bacterium]
MKKQILIVVLFILFGAFCYSQNNADETKATLVGHTRGELSLKEILAQEKLGTTTGQKIISFSLCFIYLDTLRMFESNSDVITKKMKNKLAIVPPETKLYFDDLIIKNTDGTPKKLPLLVIKVK